MRRRREQAEVIGMPFLDMISCAFGGVVVLYLLTPQTNQEVEPFLVTRIVEVRMASDAPFQIGARFPAGTSAQGCFEKNCVADVGIVKEWSRSPGRLTAVLEEDAIAPNAIGVVVLEGPGLYEETCLVARVEVEGEQRIIALQRVDGFRRKLDPFDALNVAPETCP